MKDKEVYVNLFVANESTLEVAGKKVGLNSPLLSLERGYTSGRDSRGISDFAMKIRIPGWVQGKGRTERFVPFMPMAKNWGYTVKVNGKPAESTLEKGLFYHSRKWKKGDIVDIHFDMEPRL